MSAAEKGQGEAPMRDLKRETLVGVLNVEILVHKHCYQEDGKCVVLYK